MTVLPRLSLSQVRPGFRGRPAADARPSAQYGADHIHGAIIVGLAGQFAAWCGALLPADPPLILVSESRPESRGLLRG